MKVWITKYVITEGILEAEGEVVDKWPKMFCCNKIGDRLVKNIYFHGEGKEWHRTEAEAKARANAMVAAKVKSLEKSLEKVRKLVF